MLILYRATSALNLLVNIYTPGWRGTVRVKCDVRPTKAKNWSVECNPLDPVGSWSHNVLRSLWANAWGVRKWLLVMLCYMLHQTAWGRSPPCSDVQNIKLLDYFLHSIKLYEGGSPAGSDEQNINPVTPNSDLSCVIISFPLHQTVLGHTRICLVQEQYIIVDDASEENKSFPWCYCNPVFSYKAWLQDLTW